MDKFRALQTFVAVAECAGFAAAARKLNMSPPAVTRYVSMLEEELGTRLFTRTTRTLNLTQAGERFLADSTRVLADLAEAEDAAVGSHGQIAGELRVTAPVLFGRMFVTPILAEFLAMHSQVTARTLFVDRNVNLIDEGLDVAVRIGELADSSLTATRCGWVRQAVFALPDYLDRNGRPAHPRDLAEHRVINAVAVSESSRWQFNDNGRTISVPVDPRVRMNTNDAVIEMVLAGQGIARLLSYQVARHLADGRLVPVLSRFEPPAMPIHVLHAEGRRTSARVRSFVDHIAGRIRADASLQEQQSK
ncbi:MAG: LysR family transcriptional regulator [Rhizobiaceae bacterium]